MAGVLEETALVFTPGCFVPGVRYLARDRVPGEERDQRSDTRSKSAFALADSGWADVYGSFLGEAWLCKALLPPFLGICFLDSNRSIGRVIGSGLLEGNQTTPFPRSLQRSHHRCPAQSSCHIGQSKLTVYISSWNRESLLVDPDVVRLRISCLVHGAVLQFMTQGRICIVASHFTVGRHTSRLVSAGICQDALLPLGEAIRCS
jgi:hypothetical protein